MTYKPELQNKIDDISDELSNGMSYSEKVLSILEDMDEDKILNIKNNYKELIRQFFNNEKYWEASGLLAYYYNEYDLEEQVDDYYLNKEYTKSEIRQLLDDKLSELGL